QRLAVGSARRDHALVATVENLPGLVDKQCVFHSPPLSLLVSMGRRKFAGFIITARSERPFRLYRKDFDHRSARAPRQTARARIATRFRRLGGQDARPCADRIAAAPAPVP